MQFIKFTIGVITLLGAALGVVGSFNQSHLANKLVGLLIFAISFLTGLWILMRKWGKMYNYLLIFFLVQVFAIKSGVLSYLFASIGSLVVYFTINSTHRNFYFLSLPYFSLATNENYEGIAIGINFIAIFFIAVIWQIGNGQNSSAKNGIVN